MECLRKVVCMLVTGSLRMTKRTLETCDKASIPKHRHTGCKNGMFIRNHPARVAGHGIYVVAAATTRLFIVAAQPASTFVVGSTTHSKLMCGS